MLRESDPTRSHIPDNLDQYAHRTGHLAAMLARPLRPTDHHLAITLIGRIIRTASICANLHMHTISTNQADAALVTHALDDIAILAPALPTSIVDPLHRDTLIATIAGKIPAVQTLAPTKP